MLGILKLEIRTAHLDIIKDLFVHQLMHRCVVLKKAILKFTLKQLRLVPMLQLHRHQGVH